MTKIIDQIQTFMRGVNNSRELKSPSRPFAEGWPACDLPKSPTKPCVEAWPALGITAETKLVPHTLAAWYVDQLLLHYGFTLGGMEQPAPFDIPVVASGLKSLGSQILELLPPHPTPFMFFDHNDQKIHADESLDEYQGPLTLCCVLNSSVNQPLPIQPDDLCCYRHNIPIALLRGLSKVLPKSSFSFHMVKYSAVRWENRNKYDVSGFCRSEKYPVQCPHYVIVVRWSLPLERLSSTVSLTTNDALLNCNHQLLTQRTNIIDEIVNGGLGVNEIANLVLEYADDSRNLTSLTCASQNKVLAFENTRTSKRCCWMTHRAVCSCRAIAKVNRLLLDHRGQCESCLYPGTIDLLFNVLCDVCNTDTG